MQGVCIFEWDMRTRVKRMALVAQHTRGRLRLSDDGKMSQSYMFLMHLDKLASSARIVEHSGK